MYEAMVTKKMFWGTQFLPNLLLPNYNKEQAHESHKDREMEDVVTTSTKEPARKPQLMVLKYALEPTIDSRLPRNSLSTSG